MVASSPLVTADAACNACFEGLHPALGHHRLEHLELVSGALAQISHLSHVCREGLSVMKHVHDQDLAAQTTHMACVHTCTQR